MPASPFVDPTISGAGRVATNSTERRAASPLSQNRPERRGAVKRSGRGLIHSAEDWRVDAIERRRRILLRLRRRTGAGRPTVKAVVAGAVMIGRPTTVVSAERSRSRG
jgi:hypothetical protein